MSCGQGLQQGNGLGQFRKIRQNILGQLWRGRLGYKGMLLQLFLQPKALNGGLAFARCHQKTPGQACIGGGGQPVATNMRTVKARTLGLNTEDRNSTLRKSHENPEIAKIYKEFLGSFVSPLAHDLLHTHYTDRSGEKRE